jgi:hypothetical protein
MHLSRVRMSTYSSPHASLAVLHAAELDGSIPHEKRLFIQYQSVTKASTLLSIIAVSLGGFPKAMP